MYQPQGYARLKNSLTICGLLVGSVLVYQYFAYGQGDEGVIRNEEEAILYRSLQLFPQTMPVLSNAVYELSIVDASGRPQSLGRFLVPNQDQVINPDGSVRANALFALPTPMATLASAEIRLVSSGNAQQPFAISFLQGAFQQDRAFLAFDAFTNDSFSGRYMLGTPTDGNDSLNERSGVWFGSLTQGTTSLSLPALKSGWTYEGWAIVNGQSLTTGRFRTPSGRDSFNGFSDRQTPSPAIPGEDLLRDPPVEVFPGLSFPVDLAGDVVRISLEPDLDGQDPTGQSPFGIRVLEADIPNRADPRTLYDLQSFGDQLPKATVVLRP